MAARPGPRHAARIPSFGSTTSRVGGTTPPRDVIPRRPDSPSLFPAIPPSVALLTPTAELRCGSMSNVHAPSISVTHPRSTSFLVYRATMARLPRPGISASVPTNSTRSATETGMHIAWLILRAGTGTPQSSFLRKPTRPGFLSGGGGGDGVRTMAVNDVDYGEADMADGEEQVRV